jgi:GNAT superfamily N-acetyltransferase
VQITEYGPSRVDELADLVERVSGARPKADELRWFYDRNPVRPASVLLGEEDGVVIASVAISFVRMLVDGEELQVGMPVRVATDPAFQGRGIFRRLEAANEERVAAAGIPLLLTVPNAASAPVFLKHLGWSVLPSLRLWVRPQFAASPSLRHAVERFDHMEGASTPSEVLRDTGWLNWRFTDSPRAYTLLQNGGYAALGERGRAGIVAALERSSPRAAAAASRGRMVVAAPPPRDHLRYLRGGFVPTWKTLRVLGRSLDGRPLPERPHFQLGDLDFV